MRTRLALAAALGSTVAFTGGAAAAAAQCGPPYLPVYAQAASSGTTTTTEVAPELSRPLAVGQPILDTDGDGIADGVEIGERSVRIIRAGGVLEVDLGGTTPAAAPRSLGDLDGDGRSEVVVLVGGTSVIVPGSTPDGSHEATAVGVRTRPESQPGPWVGDQDGDGVGDVALLEAGDPIRLSTVVSGAALVAPGPGGTVGALEPIVTLDGDLHGIVDLGGAAPTLATYRLVEGPPDGLAVGEVTVHLTEPLRLRTARIGAPAPDVFSLAGDRPGQVTAWETSAGHQVVVLSRSDRGASTIHAWDLDALCAAPAQTPAAAGPDTASPAPQRELPRTGTAPAVPLVGSGLALVAAGVAASWAGGRRRHRPSPG